MPSVIGRAPCRSSPTVRCRKSSTALSQWISRRERTSRSARVPSHSTTVEMSRATDSDWTAPPTIEATTTASSR